jgi:ATP-dependent Zn protease
VSSFLLASQGGGAVSCGDSEEVRRTEEVLQWAAMALVEKHWPEIEAVANALLEREELNGSQVAFLCETEKVRCAEKQKGA